MITPAIKSVVNVLLYLLLKNMINALFSSRESGTKGFELDGVTFGWGAITALYERECDRVHRGLTRMVPKLKEVRDSWTKLNVTPAKIMQVCTYTMYYQ